MGSPGTAKAIFGPSGKGLLFDLGQALAPSVPLSPLPIAIVQAVVGGITGLDGSGFSGLPLVGSLAQALGRPHSSMSQPWGRWASFSPWPWAAARSSPGP